MIFFGRLEDQRVPITNTSNKTQRPANQWKGTNLSDFKEPLQKRFDNKRFDCFKNYFALSDFCAIILSSGEAEASSAEEHLAKE